MQSYSAVYRWLLTAIGHLFALRRRDADGQWVYFLVCYLTFCNAADFQLYQEHSERPKKLLIFWAVAIAILSMTTFFEDVF